MTTSRRTGSTGRKKKGNSAADDLWIAAGIGAILFSAASLVGMPGAGIYFSLMGVTAFLGRPKLVATAAPGAASSRRLRQHLTHPGAPPMGFGTIDTRWPPCRLSAWWALLGSAALAAAPAIAYAFVHHIPRQLVSPITVAGSGGGYFLAIQAALAARRDRTNLPPVTVTAEQLKVLSPKLIGAATTGGVVGATIYFALAHLASLSRMADSAFTHRAPLVVPAADAVAAATTSAVLVAAAIATASYSRGWLTPHRTRLDLAETWTGRWRSAIGTKAVPPQFAAETRTPEDSPTVCTADFLVPPSATLDTYLAAATALAPILGVEMVLIAPTASLGADGTPITGQASVRTFKVEYPVESLGANPHLRHDLDRKALEFAVNWRFRQIFADLKLGQPVLWGMSVLTTDDSPSQLVETAWKLPVGTTFEAFAKTASDIAEKAEVPWLRVGRRTTTWSDGKDVTVLPIGYVSILFGDPPTNAAFKTSPTGDHAQFLDMIEWDARFRGCGLAQSSGIGPTVVDRSELDGGVTDYAFAFPLGLAPDDIAAALPALRAGSGYAYIDLHRDPNPKRFHLYVAATNPLEADYPFREWAPAILRSPTPGQPSMKWALGVTADQRVLWQELGDRCPHVLVGGETGGGKSQALEAIVLQLAVANTPTDLTMCLIDPKTALPEYAHLAHVSRLVIARPDHNFHEAVVECLTDLHTEMIERYHTINGAGAKDLLGARTAGKLLDIPLMLIIMDEVSMVFNAKDKKVADAIEYLTGEIAILGRAAGMHMVLATQFPSNAAAVPNHLREQLVGRIGFKTRDYIGSRNIIGSKGCEDLGLPGMGIVVNGADLVRFRGFFLNVSGPVSDQQWVLSHLPQGPATRRFDAGGKATEIPHAPSPDSIWNNR